MKFKLSEVFDAYVVVDNDTGRTVKLSECDDNFVALSFIDDGQEYEAIFDGDQIVEADGDIFKAIPNNARKNEFWDFRALTVVRLNEVPELR